MLIFLHSASSCFSGRTNKTPNVPLLNELSVQETFQLQHSHDDSHHNSTNRLLYRPVSDQLQPSELSHLYRSIHKSRLKKNVGCYQTNKIVEKSVYQTCAILTNSFSPFQTSSIRLRASTSRALLRRKEPSIVSIPLRILLNV